MAAPDDDQDLVTIRIPRRAAAMYAAELDVVSSPWMMKVNTYGGIVASCIVFLAVAALLITGVIQVAAQEALFAANCFAMAAIAGGLGVFFFVLSLQRLRTAKARGLL